MEVGHWIAIGVPAAGIAGTCAVKIMRLFGRVATIEKACDERCSNFEQIEKKQAIALVALREILVKMGIREPGQGINGEDK